MQLDQQEEQVLQEPLVWMVELVQLVLLVCQVYKEGMVLLELLVHKDAQEPLEPLDYQVVMDPQVLLVLKV